MTERLDCILCESRKPLNEAGMCADCASFPVLVRMFDEGLQRKAATEGKRDGVD